jgi:hypothetical protein
LFSSENAIRFRFPGVTWPDGFDPVAAGVIFQN